MPGDGRRPLRVAEQIREFLSSALTMEFADPRLGLLVVTRVEVTPDLGIADVFLRAIGTDEAAKAARGLRAVQHATNRLRRGLAPHLGLKRVPELRFHHDTGPDARARIDQLLDEWHAERSENENSEEAG